jgi:hypothetical protein
VSGGNRNGMESAGSGLARISPEFVVSKQKLRQAEGSCIVRLKREEGKQNLGFSSRPFVLCGLPVRKPLRNEMLYERRNGNFVLQITGHPNYGLPFGQDRIVPIYLATLAVRQKSQTIRFRTAAEMLETFDMHKGGKEYRRLVAAFERIFGATIFFGTDSLSRTARVVQRSRFSFFHEAQIWYSRDPHQKHRISGVRPNQRYFAGPWGKSRGIIGRWSVRKRGANGRERVRRRDGAGEPD